MCVCIVYIKNSCQLSRCVYPISVHVPCCRGELPLLDVWKNALKLFVWNKHFINKQHEFAIVILNEKAQWVRCDVEKGRQDSCC